MSSGQIIVTGGSRGIGAAIVEELARGGRDVIALSRSGDAPAGRGIRCDVTRPEDLAEAIAAVAARGPLAGLVNNAGAHVICPAAELEAEAFEGLMRLNVTSMLVASRAARPHMAAAGGGLIVNMGSFFADYGVAGNLAYCASKAAVGALTRCLAVEWAADAIRVLNMAPGYIETDLNRDFLEQDAVRRALVKRIPAGRIGRAEDVASLVGLLFADESGFLTGETIRIDGGQGVRL